MLGIPEMLACVMAREVLTTASANGNEEAGPINGPGAGGAGGAVVAVPATSACGVELCGAPMGTSCRVAEGATAGVVELVAG